MPKTTPTPSHDPTRISGGYPKNCNRIQYLPTPADIAYKALNLPEIMTSSAQQQQQLEHSLDVLAVTPNQSWDDIEKYYRQLVQRWHPDRNPDDSNGTAKNRFIEINCAFNSIREHYRKTGAIPKRPPPEQNEPLLGIRKQIHVKPVFFKNKVVIASAAGLTVLIIFGAILWSLDARMVENNRDRANAAKTQTTVDASESVTPGVTTIEQSSNDSEP